MYKQTKLYTSFFAKLLEAVNLDKTNFNKLDQKTKSLIRDV